jgi:hypothetical protein
MNNKIVELGFNNIVKKGTLMSTVKGQMSRRNNDSSMSILRAFLRFFLSLLTLDETHTRGEMDVLGSRLQCIIENTPRD